MSNVVLQEAVGKNIRERHARKVSQRFKMVILEVVSTGPGNLLDEGSKGDSNVI